MNNFFERYEFLEVFDKEKIYDEQIGSFSYSIALAHNFLFEVSMVVVEETVIVTLYHKSLPHSIFDIGFHEIDRIALEKTIDATFLHLYKNVREVSIAKDETMLRSYARIMIKPSVAIQLSL